MLGWNIKNKPLHLEFAAIKLTIYFNIEKKFQKILSTCLLPISAKRGRPSLENKEIIGNTRKKKKFCLVKLNQLKEKDMWELDN